MHHFHLSDEAVRLNQLLLFALLVLVVAGTAVCIKMHENYVRKEKRSWGLFSLYAALVLGVITIYAPHAIKHTAYGVTSSGFIDISQLPNGIWRFGRPTDGLLFANQGKICMLVKVDAEVPVEYGKTYSKVGNRYFVEDVAKKPPIQTNLLAPADALSPENTKPPKKK